jgi:hypothetical protein
MIRSFIFSDGKLVGQDLEQVDGEAFALGVRHDPALALVDERVGVFQFFQ